MEFIKKEESMEKIDVNEVIKIFIQKMKYLENEHALGCFFYGSFLTGYNNSNSDIDLHIIFDNSDSKHLIRGNMHINGVRIEYFEKPINDLYLSINNDYNNQNNALLSIVGTSKIIFDKTGDLQKLQKYACSTFSKPLPPLDSEEAREYVSILSNRMEKVEKTFRDNSPYFNHLYHLTLEKIRKFYHRLNGMPELQTSKVFRTYTDEAYRMSFYKDKIPEKRFVKMYLEAICDESFNNAEKLQRVQSLFDYAKRNVSLNKDNYRILIKSRNITSCNDEFIIKSVEEINEEIMKLRKANQNIKGISDGYHTFKDYIEVINIYFIQLLNAYPDISWKSKNHFDEESDTMLNEEFIAGINTPDGIIVKHLKMYYWDEVNVEEIDRVPQYDRYTEDEVKFRIKSLGKIKK